jgi:hypothetical protein
MYHLISKGPCTKPGRPSSGANLRCSPRSLQKAEPPKLTKKRLERLEREHLTPEQRIAQDVQTVSLLYPAPS